MGIIMMISKRVQGTKRKGTEETGMIELSAEASPPHLSTSSSTGLFSTHTRRTKKYYVNPASSHFHITYISICHAFHGSRHYPVARILYAEKRFEVNNL